MEDTVGSKTVDEDHPFVRHARVELGLLGEEEDVIEWYVDVIKAFFSFGHSGGSFDAVMPVLLKLLYHENLTKLTDNPEEWEDVSEYTGKPLWQSKRNSSAFSKDGGKTFWLLSNPGSSEPTYSIRKVQNSSEEQ